ncbi:MAG: GHKL domain-containing protein [Ruminiclostridium sp.]|nr:GHKL domain-containing protein [Ruminiclostridium sp.]
MENYQSHYTIRRTLRKRIRKTISFCILVSILLFGVIIGYYFKDLIKIEFSMVAKYLGNSIAQIINSEDFRKEMNIEKLEDLNMDTEKAQQWLLELKELENRDISYFFGNDFALHGPQMIFYSAEDEQEQTVETALPKYFQLGSLLRTTIVFKGSIVYPLPADDAAENNLEWWEMPEKLPPMMNRLQQYFDIRYEYDLYDSQKEVIGNVTVQANPMVIVPIFFIFAILLLFVGLASLIVTNIISKPLANRIIKPIQQMEKTFRNAAEGDYSGCDEKPIQIRRPLREIESMVFSTNIIINKLKRYNDEQEQQKVLLQQQNIELEAQNQELADSKLQIEQAQSQLIQMEKMAQVGQLTAAISHEINTPLGVISSNVQLSTMLTESLEQLTADVENPEVQDMVAQISEAAKTSATACRRMDEIIKNLRVFSKIDQSDFQEADINAGVRSTVVLTTNLWKKNTHIIEEYGELPPVKCYAGLLNQVFMNIMVNAIQSIEKTGEIQLKTWYQDEKVWISIRDNGKGIPQENLQMIFDFGFSTKEDKGMGIGLSMSQDIIRKHSGQIFVDSELGRGTTFTISIPVTQ